MGISKFLGKSLSISADDDEYNLLRKKDQWQIKKHKRFGMYCKK